MHARGSCDSKCVICVFSLNRCRQGPGDRRRNGWRPMKPLSGHVAACRRATVMGSSVRSERDQSWGQPPTTRGWVAQCVRRGHSCTTSPDAARAPQPRHLRHSDGAAATTATSCNDCMRCVDFNETEWSFCCFVSRDAIATIDDGDVTLSLQQMRLIT